MDLPHHPSLILRMLQGRLQQLVADEQRPAFNHFCFVAGRFGWLSGIYQIRSREKDQADQGYAGLHGISLVE